ncbi:MAG TPA: DNA gyrase inhibitor YacG [Devosia sp.]|nr:DNA gyrase inhibitor YacG [Devosia sp.]
MSGDRIAHLRPVRPCPICKKPSSQAIHPFCSNRCADIDLNRWLSGAYVIPARDDEQEDEQTEHSN